MSADEPLILDLARRYSLIASLETDLRRLILDWLAPAKDADDLFGARLETLCDRAAADGSADVSPHVLVGYLDFGDAVSILNQHAAELPAEVARGLRALNPQLEGAVRIRNRVMHARPIEPDDDEHLERLVYDMRTTATIFPATTATLARLEAEPDWSPQVEPTSSTADDSIVHNLPVPEFDETGLIGRAEEEAELLSWLLAARYPVISVVGEGGIGKTALVVKVLYDILDAPASPYDAILWVSLKTERLTGRGVQQIADAAHSLTSGLEGLAGSQAEDLDSIAGEINTLVEGSRVLFAIDNLESANPQEVLSLVDLLPAEARFVFTSRVGLGELERRVPLGALKPGPAEHMFRRLARRRRLAHLVRLPSAQIQKALATLRFSPLAIRWFIEAVDAGAEPDELLTSQDDLLQFCVSSIYDTLSSSAVRVAQNLLSLGRQVSLSELVVLMDEQRDVLRAALIELQRRSLVVVQTQADSLTQTYALSSLSQEFLALQRQGLASSDSDALRRRDADLRRADEDRRRSSRLAALAPASISADGQEERAAAALLRKALSRSRNGEVAEAEQHVRQALQASPDYHEAYRVWAYVTARSSPDGARARYERAYELAPSDDARARVAYWLAGHLSLGCRDPEAALPRAQEAHARLQAAATAVRLGQVLMFLDRFEEAETALREAVEGSEHQKPRLIAQTSLLSLAKRRVERVATQELQPLRAFRIGLSALQEAWAFSAQGIADLRMNTATADLMSEMVRRLQETSLRGEAGDDVVVLLEGTERWLSGVVAEEARQSAIASLRRLANRDDCPEHIRETIEYVLRRASTSVSQSHARRRGVVVHYSQKKRGGALLPEGGDSLYFSTFSLRDEGDQILLVADAVVSFVEGRNEIGPCAEDVCVEVSDSSRRAIMEGRRVVVERIQPRFLFGTDLHTQASVFVHLTAFAKREDWERVSVGDEIECDLDVDEKGPHAVTGSATRQRPTSISS